MLGSHPELPVSCLYLPVPTCLIQEVEPTTTRALIMPPSINYFRRKEEDDDRSKLLGRELFGRSNMSSPQQYVGVG